MNSKELQNKYNDLKDELDGLKIEKAKAETTLESLSKEKAGLLKELKELAGTEDITEAKAKLEKLNNKLSGLVKEAEEIINGN